MTDYELACLEDFFSFILTASTSDDYIGTIVYNISLSNGDIAVKSVRLDLDKPILVWNGYPPDNEITVDTSCNFDTFFGLYSATLDPTNAVLTGKVSVKSWRYRQLSTIMSKFDFGTEKWDNYYKLTGKPDFSDLKVDFLRVTGRIDPNQPAQLTPEELYDQQCSHFQEDMVLLTPKNIKHIRELMGLSTKTLTEIKAQVNVNVTSHFDGSSSAIRSTNLSDEDKLKLALEQLSKDEQAQVKLDLVSQYLLNHIHTQQELEEQRHDIFQQFQNYITQHTEQNEIASTIKSTFTQLGESVGALVDQSFSPLSDTVRTFSPHMFSSVLAEQLIQYCLLPLQPKTSSTITPSITSTTIPEPHLHPDIISSRLIENATIMPIHEEKHSFESVRTKFHQILKEFLPLAALRSFHYTDSEFYLHSHVAWQFLSTPSSSPPPTPTSTQPTSSIASTANNSLIYFPSKPLNPINATFHYPPDVYKDEESIITKNATQHLTNEFQQQFLYIEDRDPSYNHEISPIQHNPAQQFIPTQHDQSQVQHKDDCHLDIVSPNHNTLQRTKVISQLVSYPSSVYEFVKTNYAPTYNPHPQENVHILASKFQSQYNHLCDILSGDARRQHQQQLEPHYTSDHDTCLTHSSSHSNDIDDEAFNQSVKELVDVFTTNPALLQPSGIMIVNLTEHPTLPLLRTADENFSTPINIIISPTEPPLSIDQLKLQLIKMQQKILNFAQDFKNDINLIRDDLTTEYRQVFRSAIGDDLEKNVEKMRILTKYMQYQLMLYRAAVNQNVERSTSVQATTTSNTSLVKHGGALLPHTTPLHHHQLITNHHHEQHPHINPPLNKINNSAIPLQIASSDTSMDSTSIPMQGVLTQEELLYHNIAALSLASNHVQIYHHTHDYFTQQKQSNEKSTSSKNTNNSSNSNNSSICPLTSSTSNIQLDSSFIDPLHMFSQQPPTPKSIPSTHLPLPTHSLHQTAAWKMQQQQQQLEQEQEQAVNSIFQSTDSSNFQTSSIALNSSLLPPIAQIPSPETQIIDPLQFQLESHHQHFPLSSEQYQQPRFTQSDYIPLKDKGLYFKDKIQAKLSKIQEWYDNIDSSWLHFSSQSTALSHSQSATDPTNICPLPNLEEESPFVRLAHPYDLYMYSPSIHLDEIIVSGAQTTPTMQSALYAAMKAIYYTQSATTKPHFDTLPRLPFSLESNTATSSNLPVTVTVNQSTENPLEEIQSYLQLGYPLESAVVFVATGLVQNNIKITLEPEAFVLHEGLKKDTIMFYTGDDVGLSEKLQREQLHKDMKLRQDEALINAFNDIFDFPTHFTSSTPASASTTNTDTLSPKNDDLLEESAISRYYYQYLEPNQEAGINPAVLQHYATHLYDKLYPVHTRGIVPIQDESKVKNHPLTLALDQKNLAIYLYHKKNSSFLWYYLYPMIKKYNTSLKTFIVDPLLRWGDRKTWAFSKLIMKHFHPFKEAVQEDALVQYYKPHLHKFQRALLPHIRHKDLRQQWSQDDTEKDLENSMKLSTNQISIPIPVDSFTDPSPLSELNSSALSQEEVDKLAHLSSNHTSTRMTDFFEALYTRIITNRYNQILLEPEPTEYNNDVNNSIPTPTSSSRLYQHFHTKYPAFNESCPKNTVDGSYFLPFPATSSDNIDQLAELWLSHSSTKYLSIPAPDTTGEFSSDPTSAKTHSYVLKHKENPFSLAGWQYKLIQHHKNADRLKQQQDYLQYRYGANSSTYQQTPLANSSSASSLQTTSTFNHINPASLPSHYDGSNGPLSEATQAVNEPASASIFQQSSPQAHNNLSSTSLTPMLSTTMPTMKLDAYLVSNTLSLTAQFAIDTLSHISDQFSAVFTTNTTSMANDITKQLSKPQVDDHKVTTIIPQTPHKLKPFLGSHSTSTTPLARFNTPFHPKRLNTVTKTSFTTPQQSIKNPISNTTSTTTKTPQWGTFYKYASLSLVDDDRLQLDDFDDDIDDHNATTSTLLSLHNLHNHE